MHRLVRSPKFGVKRPYKKRTECEIRVEELLLDVVWLDAFDEVRRRSREHVVQILHRLLELASQRRGASASFAFAQTEGVLDWSHTVTVVSKRESRAYCILYWSMRTVRAGWQN